MRLATFLTPDGTERAGEVRGDTVVAFAGGSVRDRLASGETTPADGDEYALADVTLLAPVPRPRAIFGIGLNYAKHAAETGKEPPEQPMVFMKLPTSSVPGNGTVEVPAAAAHRLDYEAELVVVIGAGRRDRRLRGRRRPLRPRPPGPRDAVDARQGLRRLLSLGPLDHHRRRGPRRVGAADRLDRSTARSARTPTPPT